VPIPGGNSNEHCDGNGNAKSNASASLSPLPATLTVGKGVDKDSGGDNMSQNVCNALLMKAIASSSSPLSSSLLSLAWAKASAADGGVAHRAVCKEMVSNRLVFFSLFLYVYWLIVSFVYALSFIPTQFERNVTTQRRIADLLVWPRLVCSLYCTHTCIHSHSIATKTTSNYTI
jgi:hypothetical protein